jgi:alpha-1,6-mannosyltransferase
LTAIIGKNGQCGPNFKYLSLTVIKLLIIGVEQRSGEWGVEPFTAYFLKYLPKIAWVTIFAVLLTFRFEELHILILALIHLVTMSVIGHKEWRFIIYVVPLLNAMAALGISSLNESTLVKNTIKPNRKTSKASKPRQSKSNNTEKSSKTPLIGSIRVIFLLLLIFISFIASFGMSYISSMNYPGAEALNILHKSLSSDEKCYIHIDSYAGNAKFNISNEWYNFISDYSTMYLQQNRNTDPS